ncbi:hypothetical protein MBANPS3_005779 [Mucor bainieri]
MVYTEEHYYSWDCYAQDLGMLLHCQGRNSHHLVIEWLLQQQSQYIATIASHKEPRAILTILEQQIPCFKAAHGLPLSLSLFPSSFVGLEMGVKGAWTFLDQHGITGTTVKSPMDALGWRETQKKIHVDIVGAFFKPLKRIFIDCEMDNQQAMTNAAHKFLRLIGTFVPADRSILYLDGNPSLERDLAHRVRLTSHLKRQHFLEQEILEYEACPNDSLLARMNTRAKNSFRFTRDMKQALYQAALQRGWKIIAAPGEAEVEIGRLGGIVLTDDSDMLFYPNISIVIRQMGDHQFNVYYKSSILAKLQLSNNAFTALGIIAPNDYDSNLGYNTLVGRKYSIYKVISKIQQSGQQMSIKEILEAYIAEMNSRVKEAIPSDHYANSYRVFVLHEEHLLPHSYDIRSGYLNSAAHYLKEIRNLQYYSKRFSREA